MSSAFLLEENLFPAKVEDLKTSGVIPFDVYLKLADRYLKVVEKNQTPYQSLWDKIQDKRIEVVYIKEQDLDEFVQFCLQKANIPISKKASHFLLNYQNLLYSLRKQGVTKKNIELVKEYSKQVVAEIIADPKLTFFLQRLHQNDSELVKTLARTVYSVLIAMSLSWKTEGTLIKLAMASCLADIGLDDLDLASKPRAEMTKQELQLFLEHTKRSADILQHHKGISAETIQAILHHHEYADGSGPLKLNRTSIYPLGHIIRIAEDFVELTTASKYNLKPLTAKDSFTEMKDNNKYITQLINALAKVIH